VEGESSERADLPLFEVSGILGSPKATRELLLRGFVELVREGSSDRFVRALFVVAVLELIQELLLLTKARGRWPRRFALQILVHAFMLAVLLWASRRDALMNDAEPHPPDVEFAQAVDPL
jgi:hypothetical protein